MMLPLVACVIACLHVLESCVKKLVLLVSSASPLDPLGVFRVICPLQLSCCVSLYLYRCLAASCVCQSDEARSSTWPGARTATFAWLRTEKKHVEAATHCAYTSAPAQAHGQLLSPPTSCSSCCSSLVCRAHLFHDFFIFAALSWRREGRWGHSLVQHALPHRLVSVLHTRRGGARKSGSLAACCDEAT